MKKTQTFKGIGVSPGIAIGPVVVLRDENVIIAHCLIDKKGIENETNRLSKTIKKTRTQLQNIREKIAKEGGICHV